jgi:muramoyltetrapeptide carboxypeptidase
MGGQCRPAPEVAAPSVMDTQRVKKHIYIFSPSSATRDKAAMKRGIRRMEALGHEVEMDEAAMARFQRFAGDDNTRLAGIHRAAASGADVAMISRGGYGLSRLLDRIDYKSVAKSIAKGTDYIGLSDFTAFQAALLAKTGASTWAGPALEADFGAMDEPDEITQACFDDFVLGQGEGAGWRLPASAIKSGAAPAHITWAGGRLSIKKAVLWGGNLAMLSSLVGTPYMPHVKGGILFLEDIGEHPYRVERMLIQLLHAGVLAKQKAIVFGQFTDYRLAPNDRGFKLATVIERLQMQIKAPVLTGLPFGHGPLKVVLPFGREVALMVEGRDAFLLWGHR